MKLREHVLGKCGCQCEKRAPGVDAACILARLDLPFDRLISIKMGYSMIQDWLSEILLYISLPSEPLNSLFKSILFGELHVFFRHVSSDCESMVISGIVHSFVQDLAIHSAFIQLFK